MTSARAQAGFTLVETLVALAILGLSFAALFAILSDNLDRARRSRDEAVAASLVQSLLARSEAQAPTPGVSSGIAAGGFAWRVEVTPYIRVADRINWPVDAVSIAATVTWRDGAVPQSRTLTTLRVIPKAAAP